MHRFFCSSQNISGNKIIVSDTNQVHHARVVLRLKVNDEVIVSDGKGNEYVCLIKELLDNKLILKIKERRPSFKREGKIKITVACAIPKKSKMDDIVDKLTQLGVERIIPLETERVVIKLDKSKKISRLERWKKIALNASQQSQRRAITIIEPIKQIREVLSEAGDYDLKLIPTLLGERKSLKEIFAQFNPQNILVLIGPEGDFTPQEVALAVKAGFIPLTLGKLVLRVDTAAIAVVSVLNHVLGY